MSLLILGKAALVLIRRRTILGIEYVVAGCALGLIAILLIVTEKVIEIVSIIGEKLAAGCIVSGIIGILIERIGAIIVLCEISCILIAVVALLLCIGVVGIVAIHTPTKIIEGIIGIIWAIHWIVSIGSIAAENIIGSIGLIAIIWRIRIIAAKNVSVIGTGIGILLSIEDISSPGRAIIHISVYIVPQEGIAIGPWAIVTAISVEDVARSLIGASLIISLRIIIPAKPIWSLIGGVREGAYIIETAIEWWGGVVVGALIVLEGIYVQGPIATEGKEVVAGTIE